jgi:hypothetical protein
MSAENNFVVQNFSANKTECYSGKDVKKLIFLDSVMILIKEAEKCYNNGKFRGAVECLNNAIRACVCANDMRIAYHIYDTMARVLLQSR